MIFQKKIEIGSGTMEEWAPSADPSHPQNRQNQVLKILMMPSKKKKWWTLYSKLENISVLLDSMTYFIYPKGNKFVS